MLAENRKAKMLIKDTIIFAIGGLGSKMILFILLPLYTNYLTTSEFGVADLVFTIAQLIIPFVTVSIYQAVLRFGLSLNANKSNVLLIGLLVTICGSLFSIILVPIIGGYSAINEWKWYLCVYVILSSFNLTLLNYIKILNKNKVYAFINMLQTLVLGLTNVLLLVIFNCGVKGYLIANIIACTITFFCTIYKGKVWKSVKHAKLDVNLAREMLSYSFPIIFNDISWWIIHSSDKIMIHLMVSSAALGLYTTATKIPSLINVMISIFSQAWGISSIREIESSNDNRFYADVFEVYSFLTFTSSLILVLFVRPFMQIYVGKSFVDAWKFVPLLVVSASFSAISSYFGGLYVALKKSMNSMITTLVAASINLVFNYLCIIKIGTYGAVIGTLVSYLVISIVRMIDIARFININVNYYQYIINCLLVICIACIVTIECSSKIANLGILVIFTINNFNSIRRLLSEIRR